MKQRVSRDTIGSMQSLRLWVDTDIGSNPDDALAIAALIAARKMGIALVGYSTVDGVPQARAHLLQQYLQNLGGQHTNVTAGAREPLVRLHAAPVSTKKPVQWGEYAHYIGDEANGQSKEAAHALLNAIRQSPSNNPLYVLAIGRMTNLALAAELDLRTFTRIGGLYFQGGAMEQNGRLVPDNTAGNVSGDYPAAKKVFDALQAARRPITTIGKYAGYSMGLTRAYFMQLGRTGKQAGRFLHVHAVGSLQELATTMPTAYRKVFGAYIRRDMPTSLDPHHLHVWSFPYDVMAALAVIGDHTGDQHFNWITIENNRMVGVSTAEAQGGLIAPVSTRQFVETLMRQAVEAST